MFCKWLEDGSCEVLIRGKVKKNDEIFLTKDFKAVILELHNDGSRTVEFYFKNNKITDSQALFAMLDRFGRIPLPPYLNREDDENDSSTYQSNFAKNFGSVAAPTASLHFDVELLAKIKKDFEHAYVTLHIGLGTFKSVESSNIASHKMHSERYGVSHKAMELISSNSKILAVGTTSARTVEYFHKTKLPNGECDIFLNPQNRPKRIDMLMTNFHLPKSTLIMLVSSIIGLEKTLEIYNEAVNNNYRFYSYGDAMLIL